MNLDRVLEEARRGGEYWRGDSRVWFSGRRVYCEYLPKDGHSPRGLIRGDTDGLRLEFGELIRIEAPRERVKCLVDLINSIRYPDVHVTKRAGCRIKIEDGGVAEIGEPKILYCPLAKERYGRERCEKCHEVKPFLEKEFEAKIGEGMFTARRSIHARRARYTYGASETLMDALGVEIDACVIVCDGAGTIITANPEIVQGIGEKMTGVFYTSPHRRLIEKLEETSLVLFPETARIDQVWGAKAAKRMGYSRIAVTTADKDSMNLKAIKEMDEGIVTLALCTSGIGRETAEIIKEHADLAWACGSKRVREIVGPEAWLQLGTRLPVFVLSGRGLELVKPRIKREFGTPDSRLNLDPRRVYHNLKEVGELPVRPEDEPHPLV